jgi:DnaK suppressor protein
MVTKPSAAAKKAPAKAPAKPAAKAPVKPAAKVAPKSLEKPHKEHKEQKDPKDPKVPFEKYRKRLLVRQEELILDISRNRQVTDETVDEQAQDMVDRATSAYTREFAFSLSEADRKALLLIEQALLRIEQGTYGVCVHCQGVVQEKRLEAVPWARHCLECQEMQDKGLL